MPVASAVDAALSTWYCPVGLTAGVVPGDEPTPRASGDDTDHHDDRSRRRGRGRRRHHDHRARPTARATSRSWPRPASTPRSSSRAPCWCSPTSPTRPAAGTVTLMGTDGPITTEPVEVAARSRFQADLADWVEAPAGPVAALVELDGGGVAAAVVADGPHGSTVAPCASQPSALVVPAGRRHHARRPGGAHALQPVPRRRHRRDRAHRPHPARRLRGLPRAGRVGGVPRAHRRDHGAAPVLDHRHRPHRPGRGRPRAGVRRQRRVGSGRAGRRPGAPVPSESWFFPSGVWGDTTFESYLLFNPGSVDAQVDVSVSLDDPDVNGSVQPFEVTVPAGNFAVIGSSSDDWGRIPAGVGHSVAGAGPERPAGGGGPTSVRTWATSDPASPWRSAPRSSPPSGSCPPPCCADAAGSLSLLNPSPLTLSPHRRGGLRRRRRARSWRASS